MALLITVASGCGYTFQNSRSPLSEREGIQKVYVRPFLNNSYKVGVENLVFNALQRELVQHRRIEIVSNPDAADAILTGSVNMAQYDGIAYTGAIADRNISSQYSATLACAFQLERKTPIPGRKTILWTGGFSRVRPFGSAAQAGVRGQTTATINESEFERTLSDLAHAMMPEVHESMLAMF
jgi:hypothetical protein